MLLEVPDCYGKLLLSRHAVRPRIRYYSEAILECLFQIQNVQWNIGLLISDIQDLQL